MSGGVLEKRLNTVFVGNGAECSVLATEQGNCRVRAPSENPLLLPAADEYIILIDTLSEEEQEEVGAFCATLRQAQQQSSVRNATIEGLRNERDSLRWTAEHGNTFDGIRLPLDRQILPCVKFGTDLNGPKSREWYFNLLNFALNRNAPDKRCCVLHGPSGVGKTLAIERIAEILEREQVADGQQPELLPLSAAMFDPEYSDATINSITAHANRSENNILVIDDFDVGVAKEIVARLETLRCRRIVICNNLYERNHAFLRNTRLYFTIAVNKISLPALVEYLAECFPTLPPQRRQQIAETANGDARSALIYAKWWSLHGNRLPKKKQSRQKKLCMVAKKRKIKFKWREETNSDDDSDTKDASLVGEPPHYAVIRCLRAPRGRVIEQCDRVFGEGDVDTPSQILFENHCRYNASGDLDAAAELLEMQSLGDVYEQYQWRNQFEGSDASSTDKQISFALLFSGPCAAISHAAASGTLIPQLRFPFATLRRFKHESALAIRRVEANRMSLTYTVDRDSIKAASLSSTAVTESTLDWSRMMFNRIVGPVLKNSLKIALLPKKERPTTSVIYDALGDVVKRFALLGMDAEDFAYACQRHIALYTQPDREESKEAAEERKKKKLPPPPPPPWPQIQLQTASELQTAFNHFAPTITASDAELIDDTVGVTAKRASRKTKKEPSDTADAETKKRKTAAAAAEDKKTKTKLFSKLQKQISAKSTVAAATRRRKK